MLFQSLLRHRSVVRYAKYQNSSFFRNDKLYSTLPGGVVNLLEAVVGKDNVSQAESVRTHHKDESCIKPVPPDVVIWPATTGEVQKCVQVCHEHTLPMIAFGTGTGLEGGVHALKGGVCFDLAHMDQVVRVNTSDFDVTVQAGVSRKTLNSYLRDTGLWFPVDPGADASLCGMVATSASGTNAVRYGTMRENVLNLEVVLADGRVVHTAGKGRRSRKTAAGYNLTNLFVGSEGTLGIITQATLRLYGMPETTIAAVCQFPDIQSAVDTTVAVMQMGVSIARIELLDDQQIKASNQYSHLNYQELPTLFLEFSGTDKSVEDQVAIVNEITSSYGGTEFSFAKTQEDRNELWKARHNVLYAAIAMKPGCKAAITDVCVPISHLPEMIVKTKDELIEAGVQATVLGHVGDGNFHCIMLFDPDNEEEREKMTQLTHSIARRALALEGTCTGEHGIGIGKRTLLLEEIGETGIGVMKQLKQTLDPQNLMNPGKIFL